MAVKPVDAWVNNSINEMIIIKDCIKFKYKGSKL